MMARTIQQIQQSIIDAKNADSTLSGLNSTSNVAIWRLWTYIVAVCMWTIENLFDAHKAEVGGIITNMKPHTLQWYVNKAKAYQYGDSLPDGSDTYAVIDTTKQVVAYAAAQENTQISKVRMKVAALSGNTLIPLTTGQLSGLITYMQLIKDAGVALYITSQNADRLVLNITIYYDALVLDATGKRLDGTDDTPVKNAIQEYLQSLPFNGLFTVMRLVDALQAVDGVVIPTMNSVQAAFGFLPLQTIVTEYQPESGYLNIADADLTITYTAHEPI